MRGVRKTAFKVGLDSGTTGLESEKLLSRFSNTKKCLYISIQSVVNSLATNVRERMELLKPRYLVSVGGGGCNRCAGASE